jgi:hypothetical protein
MRLARCNTVGGRRHALYLIRKRISLANVLRADGLGWEVLLIAVWDTEITAHCRLNP